MLKNLRTGPSLLIGVLGGGQLGRMMIQSAIDLDMRVEVMDPSTKAPCSKFTHRFVEGDLNDAEAVYQFGKKLDVITIEIEHVSVEGLRRLEKDGVRVIPKPDHIALIQDKGLQKQFFKENNIPTSDFILIEEGGDISSLGLPVVQKLRTGGYDGRGVQILKTASDITERGFSEASVLEKAVDIDKELGVIVARNSSGQTSIFPVVESIFDPKVNLVSSLIAPANIDATTAEKARAMALKVVESMEFEGLMAVELFLNSKGELLVNEVAPRTHNSGHHTIEANRTSQFAQHLRAVADLPLGDVCKLHNAAGMINLLGTPGAAGAPIYEGLAEALSIPGVHPHLYGKSEVKPYRKMGHVTVTAENIETVQESLLKLSEMICVSGTKGKQLTSMNKPNIAVLAGGYSGEASISIQSAHEILENIDKSIFSPKLVRIESESSWWVDRSDGSRSKIDKSNFTWQDKSGESQSFDLAFIMVHGTPGEDGILQKYFEKLDIPFTTGSSESVSTTFNKFLTNNTLRKEGLLVAKSLIIEKDSELGERLLNEVLSKISPPCFIKPNNGGSSLGVSKVLRKDDIIPSIQKAFKTGTESVIIESFLEGREFSIGVIPGDHGVPIAMPITEIITENEFFDYNAKYEGGSKEITPADISDSLTEKIRDNALKAYRILNCRGFVRVDFIVTNENYPAILELNSVPGFTKMSLLPQQLSNAGINVKDLVTRTINMFLAQAQD